MIADPALSSIVDEIYEGALEPARWHTAMRGFLDLSGGRAAFLAIVDNRRQNLVASTVVGPDSSQISDAMDLYREELVGIDPGFNIPRRNGGRFRFRETNERLTSDVQAWRDFIHHDFGSGDYHSLISPTGDSLSVTLALHTHRNAPPIDTAQEELHAAVFSHLSRAARLMVRRPALANSREALIMVDETAHVIDATQAAEEILSLQDGLTVRGGRLGTEDQAQQRALREHIRLACHPGSAARAGSWTTIARGGAVGPWLLRFEPVPLLPLGRDQKAYACMVQISGKEEPVRLDAEMASHMFGLTPREAQVAIELVRSPGDLRAIAGDLGMGYETARSHARAILDKTNAGNRLGLIRLFAPYR